MYVYISKRLRELFPSLTVRRVSRGSVAGRVAWPGVVPSGVAGRAAGGPSAAQRYSGTAPTSGQGGMV